MNPGKTCMIYSHAFVDDFINNQQNKSNVQIDREKFTYRRSST